MNPTAERDFLKAYVLILALALFAYSCSGAVDDEFLRKVEQIESGGNRLAVGDGGASIGSFQMKAIAWREVNQARAKHRLKLYPYSQATNTFISRVYARQFLLIQSGRLTRALGRAPTQAEIYLTYCQGFDAFQKRGFLISKSPIKTQIAAQKIK